MKKLFIAIPAYDGKVTTTCAASFLELMIASVSPESIGKMGIEQVRFRFLCGESHVNRARNRLCKYFLDSDSTHLLFIDSDIIFKAQDIVQICGRNLPIVGGLYPKKEVGNPQWVINLIEPTAIPDETGLAEVKFVGTGFMLIERSVLETMIKEWPDIEYQDDSNQKLGIMWNFFHSDIDENKRWLSEDWWFCKMWRKLEGKIYADCRITLGHTGNIDFPVKGDSGKIEFEIQ